MNRRTLLKSGAQAVAGSMLCSLVPSRATAGIASTDTPASNSASAEFISTTQSAPWVSLPLRPEGWIADTLDLQLGDSAIGSPIAGFGACFNELGWTSLQPLSEADRFAVFTELFSPGKGANFTLCRMPVGANDFARDWYSYDETPGDFALDRFSIANDMETLVPFIQSALRQNPRLRLWASPWSPPTWMKKNIHYAENLPNPGAPDNGIRPDQLGKEGEDVFIQEERYFDCYARYFQRFVDAYRQQGIRIAMVMPQNEFNSAQSFPSCTWTPEGLARFIRHLGPKMAEREVELFFGTYERGDDGLLERALASPEVAKYIKGVGMQWAGKNALLAIGKRHPELTLYQSEQECGDGKNDWSYAAYCWDLMKFYLKGNATGYMYWNISLAPGGRSHWGWNQNSLLTVDPAARTCHWNHEYYLLKHVSHFVQPGARRLATDGTFDDALAYRNPDGSTAIILRNAGAYPRPVDVSLAGKKVLATMPPDSFNTLLVRQ